MAKRFRQFCGCFVIIVLASNSLVLAQVDQAYKTESKNDTASTVVGVFDQEEQVSVDATKDEAATEFLFDGGVPESIEQLRAMETRFDELTKKLYPATVNIQMGQSQGSGVVVSSDGYVLTAAHVIREPGEIAYIYFPGNRRRYVADTLGLSIGPIDSGMLKIRNPKGEFFPSIDLGVSSDVKKGQWVMAVGHPGGQNLARGLVTRVGRVVSATEGVIRTDCTLVGGDSGGPLIDMNGKLIGIHSRIGRTLADNLHVPVDQYSKNWDKLAMGLLLHKSPYLGVSLEGKTNKIQSVTEKQAADKAGMKEGDLIVKIEDIEIKSKADVRDAISELELLPRQKIKVTVLRDDKEKVLDMTVGAPPGR